MVVNSVSSKCVPLYAEVKSLIFSNVFLLTIHDYVVIIAAFIFVIIVSLTFAFVGWKCIQGTKNVVIEKKVLLIKSLDFNFFYTFLQRDPSRIKPLLILLAVTTIFSLISMFSFTVVGLFNGVFTATINGYSFLVLHSLYNIFNRECENWTSKLEELEEIQELQELQEFQEMQGPQEVETALIRLCINKHLNDVVDGRKSVEKWEKFDEGKE